MTENPSESRNKSVFSKRVKEHHHQKFLISIFVTNILCAAEFYLVDHCQKEQKIQQNNKFRVLVRCEI